MKKNLSEKQKKLIVKRYLNGETITNLAMELNSSRKTIYKWISKYSNQEEIYERRKIKLKSKKWKKLITVMIWNIILLWDI